MFLLIKYWNNSLDIVLCFLSHQSLSNWQLLSLRGKMRLRETSEVSFSDKTVQSANTLIIEVFSCSHYLRTRSLKCLSEYQCIACLKNGWKPGIPTIKERGGRVFQASSLSKSSCWMHSGLLNYSSYICNFLEEKHFNFCIAPDRWFDTVFQKG